MNLSSRTNANNTGTTAQEFVQTYLRNVDLEDYSKQLRPSEVKDFIKFFDCLKKRLIMIDRIGDGVDRSGRPYQFYNFIKARALAGCKIFPIGEWDRMINDYQDGNLQIAFTAEELVNESLNG